MRTKTLALSSLLSLIGAASAVAQTNVYSINAVGYVNVTLYPGYNIVTCPLVCSPDNTLATIMNDTNGQYQIGSGHTALRASIAEFANGPAGSNGYGIGGGDIANSTGPNGWTSGGTNTLNPGQCVWFFNPGPVGTGSNMYATFVGTVPQNTTPLAANFAGMTNTLYPDYNLVGSIVPMSGDLVTNSISLFGTNSSSGTLSLGPTVGDAVSVFDPTYDSNNSSQGGYTTGSNGLFAQNHAKTVQSWNLNGATDPATATVTEGFWYFSNQATANNNWVENFTINP